MRSIEVTAKSVDEAIFMGIDQLGLSIDQVDIEIIEEGGRRLFGIGSKQCVVRLTERAPEEVERVLEEQEKQAEQEAQEKKERQQARTREHGRKEPRGRKSQRTAPPVQDWGEPVDGGAEAAFLREVLRQMGMEDAVSGESGLYLRISGPSMGILIGRRGETLNALQYLTSLIANRQEGEYRRVIVDTENYRGRREDTLKRLAKRMAEDVRRSGKSVSLEPMNPYERRILHASLQDNPYVSTHSEGEEPFRHVVITAK